MFLYDLLREIDQIFHGETLSQNDSHTCPRRKSKKLMIVTQNVHICWATCTKVRAFEMDLYSRRNSISIFFEETHKENGFIKCKANHFRAEEYEGQNAPGESESCFFKKIMKDVLRSDRIGDINLCNEWKSKGIDIALCIMTQKRGMKMSEICKDWETIDLNKLTDIVARMGCFEMFELCQEKRWMGGSCDSYVFVSEYASLCGFFDIAEMCMRRGAGGSTNAISFAAEGGYIEIVELCKKWGANSFDKPMYYAAKNGHIEIVKLCKKWGAGNFDRIMCDAAEYGYIEIVELCKEWGAENFDKTMCHAAKYGYVEIVKLCREWGAKDFDKAMRCAAPHEHTEIAKLCREWGANSFDRVMCRAAEHGSVKTVKLCKKWGAKDFDAAMSYATACGRTEIVKLCKKWKKYIKKCCFAQYLSREHVGISFEFEHGCFV